jgi:hypothetical protein
LRPIELSVAVNCSYASLSDVDASRSREFPRAPLRRLL